MRTHESHRALGREGYAVNHKKLFRLYRAEKLAVRRRGRAQAGHLGMWFEIARFTVELTLGVRIFSRVSRHHFESSLEFFEI